MAGKPVAASCRCGGVCAGFPGVARPDCLGWVAVRAGGRRPARFPMLLVAPRVFRVPSGPAAREIATREPSARSRRSRSPAKPSGPSGTLHTGGVFHCCAHPIQAPPPTGTAAKPHSQASLVPQLTRRPPRRRCLVCWWVIGVALKVGQAPPLPPDTAVGHQPGAVCPALVSNLARSGGLQHEDLAGGVSPTCRVLV